MARRRARTLALALAATLAIGVAHEARAGTPRARAEAEARFAEAEQAAKERRFGEALAAYRAAIAADPSAPLAMPARARVDDLEAHAEGGFAPLARLEQVRRDPKRASDRAEIEALAGEAELFPPGRVRAEARLFVAAAWWRRLGDPARAIAPLEAAVADRSGDRLTRALALGELLALRRERGELREALRATDREPDLAPTARAEIIRLLRREALRTSSTALLAALAILGAGSIAWLAARARDVRDLPARLIRTRSVALALYLGGAGALLVRVHGDADARPFLWFGIAVLGLDVIARAFRIAAGARAIVRAAWAAACVVGVLAAAFLAVERTSVDYLEGLGL